MQLIEKIRKLKEAKDRKEALKEELNELENTIAELEAEINSDMLEQGLSSLKVDDVGTVYVSSRIYASVKQANIELVRHWLEMVGVGDISKPTINNQTLSSVVRDLMDKGVEIPDFINIYVKPTINIRRK